MTKFINAKCDFCGKEYIANKKSYQNSERKGQKHYCSISCQIKYRMNGKIVTCKSCGKEFYVAKSSINNSGNNFCCVRCAHDFINHSHRHSCDTREKISKSLKIYNSLNKRDVVRHEKHAQYVEKFSLLKNAILIKYIVQESVIITIQI